MPSLTKQQLRELRLLAKGPQPTFGRWRARVQNTLHSKGLVRFLENGKISAAAGVSKFADSCEITDAGRKALAVEDDA